MKILYIVTMNQGNAGGLFKATYERIIRHNQHGTSYLENAYYFDSKMITLIKEFIFKKEPLRFSSKDFTYNELKINNLNFRRDFKYYLNEVLNFEKNNLDNMLSTFLQKTEIELKDTDLIHAHWGYPNGYLAYRVSEKYNIPYFITFHGSDINKIKEKEIAFLIEAMENAEKCFFVSKQLLKNAIDLGYSGINAEVTYNGVDLERFNRTETNFKEKKVVGYIGSLEPTKGADFLPQIFKRINEIHTQRTEFIIVGDGTLKKDIQKKMEFHELPAKFTGNLGFEEIPKILEEIDVLVVPSRNEGLGMVILEANAMGIPAVGTNIGGIPEAIGYKENLINLDEDMIENMAKRVSAILANNRDDSTKYRKRVENHFSWQEIVEIERQNYLNALKK